MSISVVTTTESLGANGLDWVGSSEVASRGGQVLVNQLAGA